MFWILSSGTPNYIFHYSIRFVQCTSSRSSTTAPENDATTTRLKCCSCVRSMKSVCKHLFATSNVNLKLKFNSSLDGFLPLSPHFGPSVFPYSKQMFSLSVLWDERNKGLTANKVWSRHFKWVVKCWHWLSESSLPSLFRPAYLNDRTAGLWTNCFAKKKCPAESKHFLTLLVRWRSKNTGAHIPKNRCHFQCHCRAQILPHLRLSGARYFQLDLLRIRAWTGRSLLCSALLSSFTSWCYSPGQTLLAADTKPSSAKQSKEKNDV